MVDVARKTCRNDQMTIDSHSYKTYILYFENISWSLLNPPKLVPISCFFTPILEQFLKMSHFRRTRWQKETRGRQNTEDSGQTPSLSAQPHQMLILARIFILIFSCSLYIADRKHAFQFKWANVMSDSTFIMTDSKVSSYRVISPE